MEESLRLGICTAVRERKRTAGQNQEKVPQKKKHKGPSQRPQERRSYFFPLSLLLRSERSGISKSAGGRRDIPDTTVGTEKHFPRYIRGNA